MIKPFYHRTVGNISSIQTRTQMKLDEEYQYPLSLIAKDSRPYRLFILQIRSTARKTSR
jgi:hypothetical protein